jgi:pyruvate kinase
MRFLVKCAREVNASCIIVYTEAGGTARLLAKYRPSIPVIATTNSIITARQLSVSFGLIPFFHPDQNKDEDHILKKALSFAVESGIGKKGDHVVITSGQIAGFAEGTTTIMRVTTIE